MLRKKAMELIVKSGFDGFSMHKLAKSGRIATATIYIYFKDREDLIHQLCYDAMQVLAEATLADFDPSMNFHEGLRVQWKNRMNFYLNNALLVQFIDAVKHSPYYEKITDLKEERISKTMKQFVKNAIDRGELAKLPLEVYWSLAFAPMYQLVKFHLDGRSLGKKPFQLTDDVFDQTLELVVNSLKPKN